ncbi:N-acetylmuramoyl-L-alanine amidase [Thermophilibacter sp.]|uniref:N-acetylmuramoyl-L-alanine amidase n=1 Tax=Thermophilibacter sp. TaxID=2847309 RepID=UPI003A915776
MHSKTKRFPLLSLVVAILFGAVAVAIASPNFAFADETPSGDLPLDFIYVESRTIETGDTQNVVVAFSEDGPEVVSATLGFGRVDRDELIESPSIGSSDNAFAFSLQFAGNDAVGNYQLKEIAFTIVEEGVEREESIDLTSSELTANNTFTVVDSLLEAQDGPAVELTAYTIDDGGELREVGSFDELNLTSLQSRTKTSRPVVVLDPGHGGSDPGAMSNGLVEKDLTLAIAKYCEAELSEYAGISVSMTRETDVYVDLDERVDIAVERGASLFVSIHINSGGGVGAEVWVPNKSSWCYEAHEIGDELGDRILKKLSALGLASRGNKFDDYTINNGKFYPDGSPADSLAVIRYSRENGIPGILIEHGFIDNSHDAALLSSDYYLRQWGVADASAIAEQLGVEKAKFWLSGISFAPESCQLVGSSVKMNASVVGDVSGLCYKFVWHKVGKDWSDGNWGVIQEKTTSSEANWTPTESGDYEIICDAIGANGSVQSTTENYRVSPWVLSSVKASPSELQLGGSVTVAPVVSGETAGLRYKYSVVDLETGAWSLLAPASEEASLSWEPPAAGRYAVTVDVIDDGSYVSGSATVEVGEDWSLDAFSADPSPAFVGRPVELEASLSGTTAGLTYKFVWERGGWADWGVVSERSGSATATWTPDAPGSYTLYCDVVDSRGNAREFTVSLEVGGTAIMGSPQTTVSKMIARYEDTGHAYPTSVYKGKGAETIEDFCEVVYSVAISEDVRPEVLFAQAMYETGWLQFGGSVKAEQCNFGGLGAVNSQVGGASFPNVRTGLLAQAQHLKAYASTDALNEDVVDPRFDLVVRGCAPYLEMLDGRWAVPGVGYGSSIARIVESLL